MVLSTVTRQGYRLYAIALVLWGAWSAVWLGAGLPMDPTLVGTGWLVLSGFGALLAIGMALLRFGSEETLFQGDRPPKRRFRDSVLSSSPLHGYVLMMVVWSAVTVEWWALNLDLFGRTVVGIGWLLIALYGAGLTLGLASNHSEVLVDATPDITATDSR